MAPCFTYMGTKRKIAEDIAEVISKAPEGPLLDLFAGVSAVGTAVVPDRNIWCNDIQYFAYCVARAFFTSRSSKSLSRDVLSRCRELFEFNRSRLQRMNSTNLRREQEALASSNLKLIRAQMHDLVTACESESSDQKRSLFRESQMREPFCLFTTTYAGGYIGLQQAIDLDSIRYAIDQLADARIVNRDQRRWMIVALCQALAKASNSTGHFAQYLSVKATTKLRFLAKRRRGVWDEWRASLSTMRPVGTPIWRSSNRAFRKDAIRLLSDMDRTGLQPAVVYADPPYTSDHYSRYYHLLDTAILYDYPRISSKGQYRTKRFVSPFSVKSKVTDAFRDLIDVAGRLTSTLVLSYPDNGLLPNSTDTIMYLLKRNFRKAKVAAEISHQHSSMGASKGFEKSPVTEMIFYATN